MKTKVLQIGSGSMGTRRMRDLSARGDMDIALVDTDEERLARARERFGVTCFTDIGSAFAWQPEAVVVSTPPQTHPAVLGQVMQHDVHFFCEADIWPQDYREVEQYTARTGKVAAPSATFHFSAIGDEIERILTEELGALHAYGMCLSVDAPSWHPGEGESYYARHRRTCPSREMVPFELILLNRLFGLPESVSGTVRKRGELAIDSEDTWCLQMSLKNGATGHLTVAMASPARARAGWALGNNGAIHFDLLSGEIRRELPALGIADVRSFGTLGDTMEEIYDREINGFIAATRGEAKWPFDYYQACVGTAALAAAEKSAITGKWETVDPTTVPADYPDAYVVA